MNSVLLVDDDPIANFITERTLSKLGVAQDIQATQNGQQAINFIHDHYERGIPFPSIILLDLNMPVMNGFQFIEAFQKLDFANLEKIKIIIVTSSEDRGDKKRAELLGIRNYVVKPFSEQEMLKLLN